MAIFGGIHLDDLWLYHMKENRWTEVQQNPLEGGGGLPGKRHGHAATPDAADTGFYLFGGFRFTDDVVPGQTESGPLSDLWHIDLETGTWTLLLQTHPSGGRTYASLVLHSATLVLFAGANCHGSCTCFGDVWEYPTATGTSAVWSPKAVVHEPITRYKQTSVLHAGSLYTFGGESYKPYMYHNSVAKIRLGAPLPDSTIVATAKLAVAGLGLVSVAYAVVSHFLAKQSNSDKIR